MRRKKRFAVGVLVVVVLALAVLGAAVFAAPDVPSAADAASVADANNLTWQVIASGGATMSSTSYTMMGTVGQPLADTSTSANYSVWSGYWYGLMEVIRNLFLPVVLK